MPTENTIELSQLDLRYESYRIKSKKKEERLLLSILQKGIRDPLRGVRIGETNCLLDGFKRMRCARKLAITAVPYHSLGNDEAMGIIDLMRESFSGGLNVIEQIKLIEALKTTHGLANSEIADYLDKSNAWVSIRVTMSQKLTPKIANHILSGKFPARSYLYGILPFTRVNKIKSKEIENFVDQVAGNHLTTREIDLLAGAFFKGAPDTKEQIKNGNLKWALQFLKREEIAEQSECTSVEQSMLQGLKKAQTGITKINRHYQDKALRSGAFYAQANLLTKSILDSLSGFSTAIRSLYDRSR